jgi:ligand-binding sensor protein
MTSASMSDQELAGRWRSVHIMERRRVKFSADYIAPMAAACIDN